MAIPRLRPFEGPPFLSYGFRPFFLLGSLYAGLSVIIWVPLYMGAFDLRMLFSPVDWHVHELLFGYLAAIVAGFLLTAIPNWTGRLPVQGLPLFVLVLLWGMGRFAVHLSATLGWHVTAVIDCAFLAAFAVAVGREIVAGRNWRNLKVLVPVVALLLANGLFHVEAHVYGSSAGRRLGLAAAITLIMLIGGRIIPSFTRNWLVRERPGRLPVPFGRYDGLSIAVSVLALAAWTVAPDHVASATLMACAAVLQAGRLGRWAGDRTWRDPLVVVLHLAYAFVPLGFALLSLAVFAPGVVPYPAGIHALGVGAIGGMTLSVMVRATLGHTGRVLKAGRGAVAIFAAVILAALLRITAAFDPHPMWILAAGLAWVLGFLGFAAVYGPALTNRRL